MTCPPSPSPRADARRAPDPRVRAYVSRQGTRNVHTLWLWGPGICEGVVSADGSVRPPRQRVRADGTNPVPLHRVWGDAHAPRWLTDLAADIDGQCTREEAHERVAAALARGGRSIGQSTRQARARAA